MTPNQEHLQNQLNAAYFAFTKNPSNQQLADAYSAARDALLDSLDTPAHKALRAACATL